VPDRSRAGDSNRSAAYRRDPTRAFGSLLISSSLP